MTPKGSDFPGDLRPWRGICYILPGDKCRNSYERTWQLRPVKLCFKVLRQAYKTSPLVVDMRTVSLEDDSAQTHSSLLIVRMRWNSLPWFITTAACSIFNEKIDRQISQSPCTFTLSSCLVLGRASLYAVLAWINCRTSRNHTISAEIQDCITTH